MAALILEISTRGLHRYEPLDKPSITLGRALDNDIILSDPTVAPHHLRIDNDGERIEIVNLSAVNPARIDGRREPSRVVDRLPVNLEIGRVQALLLARDHPVAPTRPLAGYGRRGHLFGHVGWAILLVFACLGLGALEFHTRAYNSFNSGELVKYVLRDTVATIASFVLALAVLERLLVNRWELRQLVTAVSLVYIGYRVASLLADQLEYLFSASWPVMVFHFGWFLLVIPAAIAWYLVHISHLKTSRSLLLALLIASPIAIPAMLQSPHLRALLTDFSPSARYQNNLSPLNWHLRDTISIDEFVRQASVLAPGEFADRGTGE